MCLVYIMKWVLEVSRQTNHRKNSIKSFNLLKKIMNEFFDCGSYRDRNISFDLCQKNHQKKSKNVVTKDRTPAIEFKRYSDIIIEHLLNLQRK